MLFGLFSDYLGLRGVSYYCVMRFVVCCLGLIIDFIVAFCGWVWYLFCCVCGLFWVCGFALLCIGVVVLRCWLFSFDCWWCVLCARGGLICYVGWIGDGLFGLWCCCLGLVIVRCLVECLLWGLLCYYLLAVWC